MPGRMGGSKGENESSGSSGRGEEKGSRGALQAAVEARASVCLLPAGKGGVMVCGHDSSVRCFAGVAAVD